MKAESRDGAPQRATFIVRLTRERRAGAAWRGEVEFIQLGERRPAGDAGTALTHVSDWLAAAGPAGQEAGTDV